MRFRTSTSLAAVAAIAAIVCPSAAQADSGIRVYKVTAEGSGTVDRSYRQIVHGLGAEEEAMSSFSWKVEIPQVGFLRDGQPVVFADGVGGIAPAKTSVTVQAKQDGAVHGASGDQRIDTVGACKSEGTFPLSGASLQKEDGAYNQNDPMAYLTLTPFSELTVPAMCDGKLYEGQSSLNIGPREAFLQSLSFPKEATQQGKIIHLVEASPAQKAACVPQQFPGTCSLAWSGTVTLDYVGQYGEGISPELTPDDLPPIPGTPNPPSTDQDDLFVPIPTGAKASAKKGTASVNVTCAAACSGTVSAYPASGGAAAREAVSAAAAKPLARAKFKGKAGKAVTVKLRFKGAALRKVRKAKKLKLVIESGGKKQTVTVKAR